jgi:hypothetical protein
MRRYDDKLEQALAAVDAYKRRRRRVTRGLFIARGVLPVEYFHEAGCNDLIDNIRMFGRSLYSPELIESHSEDSWEYFATITYQRGATEDPQRVKRQLKVAKMQAEWEQARLERQQQHNKTSDEAWQEALRRYKALWGR